MFFNNHLASAVAHWRVLRSEKTFKRVEQRSVVRRYIVCNDVCQFVTLYGVWFVRRFVTICTHAYPYTHTCTCRLYRVIPFDLVRNCGVWIF